MADRQDPSTLYKKEIKLPASIGEWTAYKPPKSAPKKIKALPHGTHRIPRESLERTLEIHHFFAIEFAHYLKDFLKASTDIFSITIEQMTYLDFLKRVSAGIIYSKLPLGKAGDAMFIIDYQLANIAINFSLGFQTADAKAKELTELEESMIQSIFGNVFSKYSECWGSLFEAPSLEIISYPNIQRETHLNLNEVITLVTTQLSVANSLPASYIFAFQNSTLKKLLAQLAAKQDKASLNFSRLPDSLLNSIQIPIIAEIGSTRITTEEVTSLEKEDVLSLDQTLNDPIRLILGYVSEAKAQPGMKGGKVSIRLLSSDAKKIKNASLRTDKNIDEISLPAEAENAVDNPAVKEDDFELPMEAEDKEEYNEQSDDMFEEENNNPGSGGV